jgi:hypothetical protein
LLLLTPVARETPMRSLRFLLTVTFLLVLGHSAASAATPVTQCGQVITGPAELVADLDCSAYPGDAVRVLSGPLRLRGFTLTGAPGDGLSAVRCIREEVGFELGRCRVIGPGTIVGSDVGIRGNIVGVKRVDLIDQDRVGVWTVRVKMIDCSVTGAGRAGFQSSGGPTKHRILRSVLSGNAIGVAYVSCISCGHAGGIKIKNSQIIDNVGSGVISYAVNTIIKGSTVTGNALDPGEPACAYFATPQQSQECADIRTLDAPEVRGSTCDTSLNAADGSNWGVCALD